MQSSDIPDKFTIPFADAAGPSYIRPIPLLPAGAGEANLTEGFPPDTSDPIASGGIPPNIQDFNGLFYQDTAWARWQAAGGPVQWDSAFSTANGGYPKGARVASADLVFVWQSIVENNTTDPDSGGAGWILAGYSQAGELFWWFNSTPPAYGLVCNGSVVLRADYPLLDAVAAAAGYATPWGNGDGSTTFNVPNLTAGGLFIRALGGNSGALGATQAFAVQTVSANIATRGVTPDGGSNTNFVGNSTGTLRTTSLSITGSVETRPVNMALLPCVRIY